MTLSIRHKVFLFSLVVLAGSGFIGYAVYESNQTLRDSEQWVQHTEEVLYQASNILALGKDIELARRGFIITNDSEFLDPLKKADDSIFVYIVQLRQLTKDNPRQQRRIDSLTLSVHELLAFSFQSIELRSRNDLAAAVARFPTKQGKRYADQLRWISFAIQQEEVSLLTQRKQTNDDSVAAFNLFLVVAFIAMLLVTVLLMFATSKNMLQSKEKEKRAAELNIANIELAHQNNEKEKRAAELSVANEELAFQNAEKEKRAEELHIANKELSFQNDEKEKRAAELIVANKELAFQNDEKEKRAEELSIANKELLAFTYVSSHDLQEPLRKIQAFVSRISESESENLTDKGKDFFRRIQESAKRMQTLIEDLLAFSRVNTGERIFVNTDLNIIIEEVKTELKESIEEKHATIEVTEVCPANVIRFQFCQLMLNLIGNALKFSDPAIPPHIVISSKIELGSPLKNERLSLDKTYCHITVRDNGIGFEPKFADRIFEVFQKLHDKKEYAGTGIGLAIVKKIVENHNGIITAAGELNKGATFDIYIPA